MMLNIDNQANLKQIALWDKAFDSFYKLVAVRISQSIATITFEALRNASTDLSYTLPTSAIMHMKYNFQLLDKSAAPMLAKLARDRSKMAPFDQWFCTFSDPQAYIKYPQMEDFKNLPLPAGYKWHAIAANPNYFYERMHSLLCYTFEQLVEIFDKFNKNTAWHHVKMVDSSQSIKYIFFVKKTEAQHSISEAAHESKRTSSTLNHPQAISMTSALITHLASDDLKSEARPKEIHVHLNTEIDKNTLLLNVSVFVEKALAQL